MFATLKNKIKEETGNEVPTLPVRTSQNRYQRGTLDSTSSVSIESLSMFEQVICRQILFCFQQTDFIAFDLSFLS